MKKKYLCLECYYLEKLEKRIPVAKTIHCKQIKEKMMARKAIQKKDDEI